MRTLFSCLILVLVLLLKLIECRQFPIVRPFKNSKLTFNTNDSLTLEIDDKNLRFFVLADQGGIPYAPYVTYVQTYTAKLMSLIAAKQNTHFQFALGDNFYFDGVTSVDDPRFKDTFEDAFNDTHLVNTPWFMALGNHDYRGEKVANFTAQLEYTYKSKRWILPEFLYDLEIKLNSELLIKALVIDTMAMCDEGTESEKEIYFRKVENKIKDSANTKAYFFLVLGHYPVWSAGVKGPNQCLVDKLRPVLHKYKVDGYFCGDEHGMQHFSYKYLNQTVEYLVSGATCFIDDNDPHRDLVDKDSLKFFWKTGEEQFINCQNCTGAFVVATADKTKMELRYINTKGEEIHRFNLNPRYTSNPNSAQKIDSNFLFFLVLFLISRFF